MKDGVGYVDHAVLCVLNGEIWKRETIRLRNIRIAQLERGRTVDFSLIREMLERGGIVLQSIKCPNCGAPLEIPSSGRIIR